MKLHWNRLGRARRSFLLEVAAQPVVRRFTLAGGSGLALLADHRNSEDFDFFVESPALRLPDMQPLKRFLGGRPGFRIRAEEPGTLHLDAEGVHMSYLATPYSAMRPPVRAGGLVIAHPVEIGLMKLSAIVSRGARKDFIDLACVLDRWASLKILLGLARKKYASSGDFVAIVQRPLVYFAEADAEPDPDCLDPRYAWNRVKDRIEKEARTALSSFVPPPR
ncbi:MAG: nucleotidyl transferase AbiEii/AbiGii toxin family protein [Candidatus Coatesbacteria bacterium]